MSAMYTIGGACLGAGLLGAASLDPKWSWLLLLGVLIVGVTFLIERLSPR